MFTGASLLAQSVKNLPAKWETQVSSLCWEDPLEKETAALSSILAWRMPWTEEPGGLQSVRSQTLRHGLGTNTFTGTFVFTEHVFWASGHITLYLDYVLQASQPVCEPNVILPLDVRRQQRFRVTGWGGEGGTPKSVSL